jgi:hypothetical protein
VITEESVFISDVGNSCSQISDASEADPLNGLTQFKSDLAESALRSAGAGSAGAGSAGPNVETHDLVNQVLMLSNFFLCRERSGKGS